MIPAQEDLQDRTIRPRDSRAHKLGTGKAKRQRIRPPEPLLEPVLLVLVLLGAVLRPPAASCCLADIAGMGVQLPPSPRRIIPCAPLSSP